MKKEFENKSREELIELASYYKSEYMFLCSFWNNEKKLHKYTKQQLKMYKDRSVELAKRYYDLLESSVSSCQL